LQLNNDILEIQAYSYHDRELAEEMYNAI